MGIPSPHMAGYFLIFIIVTEKCLKELIMAKIHILESNNNFSYKIAIHTATPSGNNAVGLSWKSCALSLW